MVTSKFNSQRTSSHQAFKESLETLKQLSTENQEQKDISLTENTLAWDEAANDIEAFFQQMETLSS